MEKCEGNYKEYSMPSDAPIECYGMENHLDKRKVLKALLGTKTQLTISAEVAKTAYITFGGTMHPQLRALTRLGELAHLL